MLNCRLGPHFVTIGSLASIVLCASLPRAGENSPSYSPRSKDVSLLILGGGVSGIIAARTLNENGITDFRIIEARDELGGRLRSVPFGVSGKQKTVELGANWVQGTGGGPNQGPENPIWTLVKKHGVETQYNAYYESLSTFDYTGQVDYLDAFDTVDQAFVDVTVRAGARVSRRQVDLSARSAYGLVGANPRTPHEKAIEYFLWDWEYSQPPELSSWIAASWNNNFTYVVDQGGFSEDNELSIDQRGFKTFIQKEAEEFLEPGQVLLNSTVKSISYSGEGVTVRLIDGSELRADYALVTFSLGVLQHNDVTFEPELPSWKKEAVHSMGMGIYTKIFLQFPYKFWFDTEVALYADRERGKYPIWQSLDHENFFPGSGVIFTTVTGDWSERVESLADEQVKGEVLGVLHKMYPNITIPEPEAFLFYRWSSDPLYRGSYSNWPASFFQEHHDNLRATVDDRLWFSGEHCSQKYYGFLHGAYFEGRDAGEELSQCIRGGGCAGVRQHYEEVKNARPYHVDEYNQ